MAKIVLNISVANKEAITALKAIEASIHQIANAVQSIKPNPQVTADLKALANLYKQAGTFAEKFGKQQEAVGKGDKASAEGIAKIIEARAKLNKVNEDAFIKGAKLGLETRKYNDALRAKTDATKQDTHATRENTEENENNSYSLDNVIDRYIKWGMSAMLVQKPLQIIKQLLSSTSEVLVKTEDTVVSLQRVIKDTVSDKEVSTALYDIVQNYGQTFENVSEIAQNFARTGMSWADTIKATEAAVIALNVAELDATESSEGLIAILNQFGLGAGDLMGVIDKLNKVADNYSVTTEKLLQAIQRMGSAAVNAGLDLNQSLGLITALSEATGRSGSTIGTALNSLIQYSSKGTALDVFAGVSEDMAKIVGEYKKGAANILDVWTGLSKEINHLTDEQADLLDQYFQTAEGSKLAEELGAELGDVYDDLAGVYSTANTFRKNYFIALLKNIDTANNATETAMDALGYSAEENSKYMDTYTAKVNALKAKWEELQNDEQGLLGVKKTLVNIASGLIDVSKYTGGVRTIMLAAGSLIITMWGGKLVTALKDVWITLTKVETTAQATQAAFGWIGIAITAASMLIGAVERLEQEAIDTWKASKKNADEMTRLVKQLGTLSNDSEEYRKVEAKIVGLLGDKAIILKDLTEGTEEYSAAVANLTKQELIQYQNEQRRAANAARQKILKSTSIAYGGWAYARAYKAAGNDFDFYDVESFRGLLDFVIQYANEAYEKGWGVLGDNATAYAETLAKLLAEYDEAIAKIGSDTDDVAKKTEDAANATDETTTATKKWKNSLEEVKDAYPKIAEAIKNLRSDMSEQTSLVQKQNSLYDAQKKLVEAIEKARQKYITDTLDKYIKGLEEENSLADKQNDILEKKNELEKAQQALEDAKKQRNVRVYNALTGTWELQANEKDVQSAQEKVATATQNVEKAIESLDDWLKKTAINEIKTAINNGDTSTKTIKEILAKYISPSQSGKMATWADQVQDALSTAIQNATAAAYADASVVSASASVRSAKQAIQDFYADKMFDELYNAFTSDNKLTNAEITSILARARSFGVSENTINAIAGIIKDLSGVDIRKKVSASTGSRDNSKSSAGGSFPVAGVFDGGGVLNGKGGIKATTEDEIVLPPWIAKKILDPVSNAEFTAFVDRLGVLFGASPKLATGSPVYANGGVSNNNSRTYTINGVPIAKDAAERYTIAELVEAMEIL